MARIRLYVEHPLGPAQRVPLSRDQAHYLFGVMRLVAGDDVLLFNGTQGEWRAEVVEAGKKAGALICVEQTREQIAAPDLWLMCAPIRKERMSFLIEKAVELGAGRIVIVQTEYTQDAKRVRQDKLQAIAIEAAEQCECLWVPEVTEVQKLGRVLSDWDETRRILFCDESLAGPSSALSGVIGDESPWAVLIGPEGGFSAPERDRIRAMECALPISLGPRILRAESAAMAALILWQTHLGDWR